MAVMPRRRLRRAEEGFSFIELLVALSLLAGVSLFIFQTFIAGMAHAGRANERAAATMVALQIMEQVRASVNPYEMVGFVDLPRTALPLPAPYSGIANPTPHRFEVAVDVTRDDNLTLTTVTVQVYRPSDTTPFVTLTTVLDDQ
ncbi:MAG: type II secretion system protein [Armatimonadota bacterium]|nr:type II secretion system protein [Armatimonadota bacterium]